MPRLRRVATCARGSRTSSSATCASRPALAAHLHLSWLDPHKERRFTVVGSQRMATFDDMALERQAHGLRQGLRRRTTAATASTSPARATSGARASPTTSRCGSSAGTSSSAVARRPAPRSDGESGLRVVRVLEELQRSLVDGKAVASARRSCSLPRPTRPPAVLRRAPRRELGAAASARPGARRAGPHRLRAGAGGGLPPPRREARPDLLARAGAGARRTPTSTRRRRCCSRGRSGASSPTPTGSARTRGCAGTPAVAPGMPAPTEGRTRRAPTRRSTTCGSRSPTCSPRAATSSTACTRCGIWSVLLLLVATAATWLLIGELTGRRRPLQLAGAAVVGMQPMAVFVSSSVNPDAGLIACFALAFWLGARVLRRGLTLRDGVALGAVTALAVRDQGHRLRARAGGRGSRSASARGGCCRIAARLRSPPARPALATRAAGRASGSGSPARSTAPRVNKVPGTGGGARRRRALPHFGLLDYLWQFYLPKLPFLNDVPGIPRLPVFDMWVKTGWARVRLARGALPELGLRRARRSCCVVVIGGGLAALCAAPARTTPGRRVLRDGDAGPARRPALDRVQDDRSARASSSTRAATCCRCCRCSAYARRRRWRCVPGALAHAGDRRADRRRCSSLQAFSLADRRGTVLCVGPA